MRSVGATGAAIALLFCARIAEAQPSRRFAQAAPAPAVSSPSPPSANAARVTGRVAVAVDLQALPAELTQRLDALALEARLLARLVEEGFAVVAPWAAPDVLLRLEPQGDAIRLFADGGGVKEGVEVSLEGGTRAELQLEIAHKAVDLARARGLAIVRSRAEAAAREPTTTPAAPARPQPLRPQNPFIVPAGVAPAWAFTAGLGVDALIRQPAIDPLLSLRAAVQPPGIFALEVSVGYSRVVQATLAVDEWQVQAGPKVRLIAIGPFRGEVGLSAGVVSHAFVDDSFRPAESAGRRLDFLLTLPVALTWAPPEGWLLGLRFAPGFAGRDRLHRGDGQVLWERGAARLEAGLQAGWDF